ncbi:MAG TPA: hypothetical protein VGQ36_19165 [Thermoanaerobaculia bacterium]|jgi:hypothetical protein|nr:hypothetical protein [Thermoanaerobaculia bacterium]
MMRPNCNRFLTWEEVTLDLANRTGWYQLDKHKNVNKGHALHPQGAPRGAG